MIPRAVTGTGVVSALGEGRALFEGLGSGARATPANGRVEVPAFDPTRALGDKGLRSLDRLTKLLLVATRAGLHDAGLKTAGEWSGRRGDEVGMIVSSAYGSLEATLEIDRVSTLEDPRYINPSRFPLTVSNSAAGYASIWEDLRALNVTVCDGNAGGLDAFACADSQLGEGRARALVVGGVEAMSESLELAFAILRAGARGAGDDRFVLGEGAALVVLEPVAEARSRGARVLAEVTGYGTRFEPPASEEALLGPSAGAVQGAIEAALADAGVAPGEVDEVVSGASGLGSFDDAELTGIARALGDAPVVAPKLGLGETLGAGGAFGVLAALSRLEPGVTLDAYRVRGAARATARTIVVTALGYYGNASALVVRAPVLSFEVG